jgi:hypothetical protein
MELLNADDPMFAFHHAMSHRGALGVMAPLTRWSAVPYLLDPIQNSDVPASMWHTDHQQAHDDAQRALPDYYGATSHGNLAVAGILADYNLSKPDQLRWWTWKNQIDHYIAASTILPPSTTPKWTFPFW